MSCLGKRLGSHRKKTRRPHKGTDGCANTLSIGSLMDETDREVSSLTDRAFKSLCVDEVTYNDTELSCSPANRRQAFTEDAQSTSVLRKAGQGALPLGKKQDEKASEGDVTFQHSAGNLAKLGDVLWNDHTRHLSNGTTETTWAQTRNNPNVSSMVKAFATARKETKNGMVMDVAGNAVTTTDYMQTESRDRSALLNIQKELSQFSSVCPQNFSVGSFTPTKQASNVQSNNMNMSTPSVKLSKGKSRKSSRHKKLSSRNFFLHSEFSPFQSWRECNRFPFEQADISDILPASDFPKWYDSSLYQELKAAQRVAESVDNMPHNQSALNGTPAAVSLPSNQSKAIDKMCHASKMLQEAKEIGNPKGLNNALVIGNGCLSSEDLHKAAAIDRKGYMDMKASCPPWRRNRSLVTKAPTNSRPCTAPANQEQSRKGEEAASPVTQGLQVGSKPVLGNGASINISHLLTPTIRGRQDTETSGTLRDARSSVDLHLAPLSTAEDRPTAEVKLRDGYKAMASSLLFKIKDNRKRVKTMYSPTRFKNLDAADRRAGSVEQKTAGPKHTPTVSEATVDGVSTAACPKAGDVKSVSSSALQRTNMQTSNHKKPAEAHISDDYLTLSSPQTVKEAGGVGSLLRGGYKSTQASSAGLQSDRLLSTSSDTPSGRRQDGRAHELCKTAGLTVVDARSGPPAASASWWSTATREELHLNRIDLSRRSEAPAKEVAQLDNEVVESRYTQKQDLDVSTFKVINSNDGISAKPVVPLGENRVTGNHLIPSEVEGRYSAVAGQTQQREDRQAAGRERRDVSRGRYDGKERDPRQESRAKHVFSTRQNQYIKNERYAIKDEEGRQAGAEGQEMRAKGNVKGQVQEPQENQGAKQNTLLSKANMHNGKRVSPNTEHEQYENQREGLVIGQPSAKEVCSERESDVTGQVFADRSRVKPDESHEAKVQHADQETSVAAGNNEVDIIYEKEKYVAETYGLSNDGKDHNKEKKATKKAILKGNVRQKVLSYSNQEELIKNKASVASKIRGTKEGKLVKRDKEQDSEHVIPMTEKVGATQNDGASQLRDRGEDQGSLYAGEKGKMLTERMGEEAQTPNGVSVDVVKEEIRNKQFHNRESKGSMGEEGVKVRTQGQGDHIVDWLSALASAVQTGDVADQNAVRAHLPSESTSYLPLDGTGHNEDIKAKNSLNNLHIDGGKSSAEEDKTDSKKRELQYYAINDHESEKEANVASPQTEGSASCAEESAISPSELEEGGWIHYLISSAKSQSQVPQTSMALSPAEKPVLFKVKDNTFRHSPIIRTVKLPFYHPYPEECRLSSPRGNPSGSEKGEDVQAHLSEVPVSHSAVLAMRTGGCKAPRPAAFASTGERKQIQRQQAPILEEEPGASEEGESRTTSMADTEEMVASAVLTEDIPSEQSEAAYSTRETPQSKPPAVPLKTEKALRRAQKLTRRIRKTEAQNKAQESRETNVGPSLDPSAVQPLPTESLQPRLAEPASELPSPQCSEPGLTPLPVVPSYSMTQRKFLQDPDSGQYYVVDMPVQVKTKTFFDPETGAYIQLPVRASDKASSPVTSSSTPASLDAFSPTYMLYHGFVPVPVASLPSQGPSLKVSASVGVAVSQERLKHSAPLRQECGKQNYVKHEQKYIEPSGTRITLTEGSLHSEDKDSINSENMDIISLGDLDDFAMENV